MILDHDPQGVIVLSVSPNSPAERGMIKKGDRLMKVEGMEVKGLNLSQIAEKIVGPVGSSVKLSLVSRGIEREVILQRVSLVELQPYQFPSADSDSSLTLAERDKIKAKIQTLTTREQRIKMQQLLQSFKDKKISKTQLFQSLDKEF